jgi:hypothetical protein
MDILPTELLAALGVNADCLDTEQGQMIGAQEKIK